jgi:YVTN family beta-propeller protein
MRAILALLFAGSASLAGASAAAPASEATPAAALLILEKADDALLIVDPTSLQPVARIAVGEDPHEIVASDDGRHAYVSNYGAFGRPSPLRTITVVDLVAQKAVVPIDLGPLAAPHGLALVGGKLYFTAEANKALGTCDLGRGVVDWVLGTGQDRTHMIAVSLDGKQIYTTNVNSATVSIAERAPVRTFPPGREPAPGTSPPLDWQVTSVAVGRGAEGFDVSPDGRHLWVANALDRTLSIVDVGSRTVAQTLSVSAARTNRLKFTPDGKLVLLSDPGGGDVVVLDASSRAEVRKIAVGRGGGGILMAPDGSRAFVALGQENAVVVIDLRTLRVSGRIATGRSPDGLAWAARR